MMPKIHNLSRLVIQSEDHVLTASTQKKDGSQFFFLPGGHIEVGESIHQAAVRELDEEAGIEKDRIGATRLIGVYEHLWDNGGEPFHEMNFVSVCPVSNLDFRVPVISRESHLSFEWKALERLPTINFLPIDFRHLLGSWLRAPVDQERFFASRFPSDIYEILPRQKYHSASPENGPKQA